MKLKIAGIRRGSEYSPNHIGNDAAIFNLTVNHLKDKGCEVEEYSEAELLTLSPEVDVIFNMVRNKEAIKRLQKFENEGKLVINSGFGIENCTREKMTSLLMSNQIPHPDSLIVDTEKKLPLEFSALGNHCWIKRGDFHAIHREDVTYARNQEEVESVLNEFSLRGIQRAVINQHLVGDLIKFYGVTGTDFFYLFYPDDLEHSKFGLEKINGKANGIDFDLDYLKGICNQAAEVLNICIYGGDCVVNGDGSLKIIDFNDWPSFAPCRTIAAPYIAQCIYEKAMKAKHQLIAVL